MRRWVHSRERILIKTPQRLNLGSGDGRVFLQLTRICRKRLPVRFFARSQVREGRMRKLKVADQSLWGSQGLLILRQPGGEEEACFCWKAAGFFQLLGTGKLLLLLFRLASFSVCEEGSCFQILLNQHEATDQFSTCPSMKPASPYPTMILILAQNSQQLWRIASDYKGDVTEAPIASLSGCEVGLLFCTG